MTCTNHQKSNRRINVPLSTSSSASWSFCSLSPVKTPEKLAKKNDNVDMISYGLHGNRVCIYIILLDLPTSDLGTCQSIIYHHLPKLQTRQAFRSFQAKDATGGCFYHHRHQFMMGRSDSFASREKCLKTLDYIIF